jgi:hypothetical protein
MTVKDFLQVAHGIEEYEVQGNEIFEYFFDFEKDKAINKFGEKEIANIYFYEDIYDARCCEIVLKE